MNTLDWIEKLPGAVTVIDKGGIIVWMNERACETFAGDGGRQLLGKSVYDCHPEAAGRKIAELLEAGKSNHYTITKRGQKKIIHQIPWQENGAVAGMVEISIPIPDGMPHFDRDQK